VTSVRSTATDKRKTTRVVTLWINWYT
jgi:hypothetical protein